VADELLPDCPDVEVDDEPCEEELPDDALPPDWPDEEELAELPTTFPTVTDVLPMRPSIGERISVYPSVS
jgi:hypothetical protein